MLSRVRRVSSLCAAGEQRLSASKIECSLFIRHWHENEVKWGAPLTTSQARKMHLAWASGSPGYVFYLVPMEVQQLSAIGAT